MLEAAAVPAAVPGIAKTGRTPDAIAALDEAIVDVDDEIGLLARRRGAIAVAGQFAGDEIGILTEFDPPLERGVVRLDDEALALRRGKLGLEARDVGLERGRAAGQRQRRSCQGGETQSDRQSDVSGKSGYERVDHG